MKVHSRKIEIKGADTVMTFDGNNELSIEAKVGCYSGWSGIPMYVELKVCSETNEEDCIHFANKNGYKYNLESDAYIGSFLMGECERTGLPRVLPSGAAQKQNAPFVQRERNSVIIRDGDKRYKLNGAKNSAVRKF